jgi:hypothetical protein
MLAQMRVLCPQIIARLRKSATSIFIRDLSILLGAICPKMSTCDVRLSTTFFEVRLRICMKQIYITGEMLCG